MKGRVQRSYTAQYRADAVRLAEEMGGSAAAKQNLSAISKNG